MIYLKILLLALVLFITLRYISWFFNVLHYRQKIRMAFLRIFPLVEMTIWFSFIFWSSGQLFEDITVYPLLTGSMIVIIVVIVGWYLLRDFISGIILKAENAFEPGQKITTSAGSGTINRLGYRSMKIINNEGENVTIPYSLLSSRNIIKPSDDGKWEGYFIRLKVSSAYSRESIIEILKNRMLEMPWIISGDKITISIIKEKDEINSIEIHFRSLNPEMAIKTEDILHNFVSETFR
jgi:small-conductance mechanosensitive channel